MVENTTVQPSLAVDAVATAAATISPQDAAMLEAKIKEAKEIAALEKMVESQIQFINSIPDNNLSPDKKKALILELRGALQSGSAASIQAALAEIAKKTDAELAIEAARDTLEMIELSFESTMGPNAWENVHTRSGYLDISDIRSVDRFARTMIETDVPKEIRKEVVQDTSRLLKAPEMAEAVKTYNHASVVAKEVVNARFEQAKKDIAVTKKDPVLKEEAQRAEDLSTGVHKEAAESLAKYKAGEISKEQHNANMKKANDEQRKHIVDNVQFILDKNVLPKEVSAMAKTVGDAEKITQTALDVFKKKRDKPGYEMSPQESASMRVFLQARTKEVFEVLGKDANAIDLEIGKGTLQERTDRAVDILKNKTNGAFDKIPADMLRKMAEESLKEAEEHKVSVKDLDNLSPAKFRRMTNEVFADVWPEQAHTAISILGKGIEAMKEGDKTRAAQEARKMGLGVANNAQWLGKDGAQLVGHAATVVFTAGGDAAIDATQAFLKAKDSISDAVGTAAAKTKDTIGGWFAPSDDTIKAQVSKLQAGVAAPTQTSELQAPTQTPAAAMAAAKGKGHAPVHG